MAGNKRLLVIDDEPGICDVLRIGFTSEGFDVQVANTGKEGLDALGQSTPALIILDVMLPDLSGWEVCQRIRTTSEVPIIMLTALGDSGDKVRGLNLGADDYVSKPFGFNELLSRVRAIMRRYGQIGPNLKKFMDIEMDEDSRDVKRAAKKIQLTAKEFELLKLFMGHPRQVLSKRFIMNSLWGSDFGDLNIVEVNVGHLRSKLGAPSLIQTIHGVGYSLRQE